jgi:hypothetical protein
MSFIVDSKHFVFSSSKAIVHDEATAMYTFDAATLFSGSAPSSAVYQTVSCESFSYTVTTKNNYITVTGITQVFIEPGFYNAASLALAVQMLLRPVLGAAFTCTYSTTTGRITMASSTNFTVFGAPLTTAWKLLGMDSNHTYSGYSSFTFPNLADMQTVSRVILGSNLPTRNRDGLTGVAFLGTFAVSAVFVFRS